MRILEGPRGLLPDLLRYRRGRFGAKGDSNKSESQSSSDRALSEAQSFHLHQNNVGMSP